MNSYSLGISGNWLVLILLLLSAIAFTLFTYFRTNPPINKGKHSLLISLRSISLVILIFALFEPVFTGFRSSIVSPKIAILLDNSTSMGITDAGGNRREKYTSAIEASKISDWDESKTSYSIFGDNVKKVSNFLFDSLNLSENVTDISTAFRSLFTTKKEDNLKAVVLFTDGSFNSGQNPIYASEEFSVPVFTVGIGDTTDPKDISIQSIIANDIAYVDNPVPINVNINSVGYKGSDIKISIFDNNNLIETKTLIQEEEIYEGTVYFTYSPKESGNRKITVKIAEKEGEITYKNNSSSVFIKVLKNKRIISIFGGSPNADISFLKQYLTSLPGIEIREFIQSSGSAFYKQASEKDISETELFVLIGFPIQTTPDILLEKINRELAAGKPIFLITSLNTDFVKLRKIEEFLPFNTASSRAVEFNIIPDFTAKAIASPLLRVDGTDSDIQKWQDLPPVIRTETFVRPKPESELIATFKVNNVPLNEPFIISRNVNSRKSVAIIGYGLHRWKLIGYASELAKGRSGLFDAYTKFMENTFRWLSVSDINRKISITTTKKAYSKGEQVEFIGQVYDASYLPVDNADIKISISNGEQKRDLSMISAGNGRYSATLEGFDSGDFSYNATVYRSGNKIGADDGRFTIGETDLEFRNLKMQSSLLRTISESSGGKFYTYNTVQSLLDDIKSMNSFKDYSITKRNDFTLWNYPWLLVVALLMLSIEWVVRKRSGMM